MDDVFIPPLNKDWDVLLKDEFSKPYMRQLQHALDAEYQAQSVYPPRKLVFRALHLTDYSAVKVVILGQDPYHGPGQAEGLSFSVQQGTPIPPSLRNIFKELQSDIGSPAPNHGSLVHWAKQGVLLLNTVLTVREDQPASHRGLGWETFTDRVITLLQDRMQPVVFLLWGRHAGEKAKLIHADRHLLLTSAHPSPLSARHGFFGSRPFSKTNNILAANGMSSIDWDIPPLML